MSIQTTQFRRITFFVDGILVTDANMADVAKWCGGSIFSTKHGTPYIKVDAVHPISPRQSMAYAGDYVAFAGKGFKVYSATAFKKSFEETGQDKVVELV